MQAACNIEADLVLRYEIEVPRIYSSMAMYRPNCRIHGLVSARRGGHASTGSPPLWLLLRSADRGALKRPASATIPPYFLRLVLVQCRDERQGLTHYDGTVV